MLLWLLNICSHGMWKHCCVGDLYEIQKSKHCWFPFLLLYRREKLEQCYVIILKKYKKQSWKWFNIGQSLFREFCSNLNSQKIAFWAWKWEEITYSFLSIFFCRQIQLFKSLSLNFKCFIPHSLFWWSNMDNLDSDSQPLGCNPFGRCKSGILYVRYLQ